MQKLIGSLSLVLLVVGGYGSSFLESGVQRFNSKQLGRIQSWLRSLRAGILLACVVTLLGIGFMSRPGQTLAVDFMKWLVGISPDFLQLYAKSLWHDLPVVFGGSAEIIDLQYSFDQTNAVAASLWLSTLLACLVLSSSDVRLNRELQSRKGAEPAENSRQNTAISMNFQALLASESVTASATSVRDHCLWLTLLWAAALLFDGEAAGLVAAGASLDGAVLLARLAYQAAEISTWSAELQQATPPAEQPTTGTGRPLAVPTAEEGAESEPREGEQGTQVYCATGRRAQGTVWPPHPRTVGSLVTVASTVRLCVFAAAFVSRARVFPTLVTLRMLAKHRTSAPWLLLLAGASAAGYLRDWTMPALLWVLAYVGLAVAGARFVFSYLRLAQSEAALREEMHRTVASIRGTRAALAADRRSVLRQVLGGPGAAGGQGSFDGSDAGDFHSGGTGGGAPWSVGSGQAAAGGRPREGAFQATATVDSGTPVTTPSEVDDGGVVGPSAAAAVQSKDRDSEVRRSEPASAGRRVGSRVGSRVESSSGGPSPGGELQEQQGQVLRPLRICQPPPASSASRTSPGNDAGRAQAEGVVGAPACQSPAALAARGADAVEQVRRRAVSLGQQASLAMDGLVTELFPREHALRLRRAVAAGAREIASTGATAGEMVGRAALAGAFALGQTASRIEAPVSLSQAVLLCARLRQEVGSMEAACWDAQRGLGGRLGSGAAADRVDLFQYDSIPELAATGGSGGAAGRSTGSASSSSRGPFSRFVGSEPHLPSNDCDPEDSPVSQGGSGSAEACVVCLSAPRQVAAVPCGHLSMCATCCSKLASTGASRCPVCRGNVEAVLQVHG